MSLGKIKLSRFGANVAGEPQLENAELAFNEADGKFYYGVGVLDSNNAANVVSMVVGGDVQTFVDEVAANAAIVGQQAAAAIALVGALSDQINPVKIRQYRSTKFANGVTIQTDSNGYIFGVSTDQQIANLAVQVAELNAAPKIAMLRLYRSAVLADGSVIETDATGRFITVSNDGKIANLANQVNSISSRASISAIRTFRSTKYADGTVIETDTSGKTFIVPDESAKLVKIRTFRVPSLPDGSVLETDGIGRRISALQAASNGSSNGSVNVVTTTIPTASDDIIGRMARGVIQEEIAKYMSIYTAQAGNTSSWISDPANTTSVSAVTLITDPATLEPWTHIVNQCIPIIEFTGGRMWRTRYGNNKELGHDPEESSATNQYVILEYTDDFYDGAVPSDATDVTWKQVAVMTGNTSSSVYVADSQLFFTHDRRLVWAQTMRYPVNTQLTCRARVISNPETGTAPDIDNLISGTFNFGPDTFFGLNFPFRPHYNGTEIRFFSAQKGREVHYRRLILHDDRAYSEVIATLPAMVDPDKEDYPEPTAVRVGPSEYYLDFRGSDGHYTRKSYNDGISWTPEVKSYFETNPATTSSKTDLSRSPSGRLVYVFNAASARYNMAISFSPKGGNGDEWGPVRQIDYRNGISGPSKTYPRVTYGMDRYGRYTGKIFIGYDRGRARTFYANGENAPVGTSGATTYNEIITVMIDEEEFVSGNTAGLKRYTTNPAVQNP